MHESHLPEGCITDSGIREKAKSARRGGGASSKHHQKILPFRMRRNMSGQFGREEAACQDEAPGVNW
jgi:hypothetical protein